METREGASLQEEDREPGQLVNTMTMEARIQHLVDKANNKLETDEKMREEVKDLKKTFNIDLEEEFYSFRLEDAKILDFKPELVENPDVTLKASIENMTKLLDGDLRPMKAYITKKLVVKGNIQDLMFLKKFF